MSAVARADFQIALKQIRATACGDCVERCQFHALSLSGKSSQSTSHVHGVWLCCGCLSTEVCVLIVASRVEVLQPPADIADWRAQRSSRQEPGGLGFAGVS